MSSKRKSSATVAEREGDAINGAAATDFDDGDHGRETENEPGIGYDWPVDDPLSQDGRGQGYVPANGQHGGLEPVRDDPPGFDPAGDTIVTPVEPEQFALQSAPMRLPTIGEIDARLDQIDAEREALHADERARLVSTRRRIVGVHKIAGVPVPDRRVKAKLA